MDQSLIEKKLDHVYDALVFVLGTRKLHVAKNRLVARRQRETAIWSAQSFLSLFILEDSHLVEMACGLPEIMLPSNKRMFKHVETLAQVCNTPNAAFYANNRLYAGTKNWRNLDSRDLFTISTYLRSLPEAKYRDIPVFLSHSNLDSNNNNDSSSNRNDNSSNSRKEKTSGGLIPYRLLTLRLTKHLMLVMLCGPAPSLSHAIELVGNIVRTRTGMKEDLQAAVDSDLHRHIPRSIQVDSGVLGKWCGVWN